MQEVQVFKNIFKNQYEKIGYYLPWGKKYPPMAMEGHCLIIRGEDKRKERAILQQFPIFFKFLSHNEGRSQKKVEDNFATILPNFQMSIS